MLFYIHVFRLDRSIFTCNYQFTSCKADRDKTTMLKIYAVAVLCLLVEAGYAKPLNMRPIIGVLAQESSKGVDESYIIASYVKWAEAAGARVVPIRINEPDVYYEELFQRINGVILPGGDIDIITSYHAKAAKKLYQMAMKAFDQGDYFPIWGTCQGLQLLSALTAGKNLLADRPSFTPAPLDFTPDFLESRMFHKLPENIYSALANENVTSNLHMYGLTPQNFSENSQLSSFYRVMSTSLDIHDNVYISAMEAYKYPFYGVQFHPEKNVYNWDLRFTNNHDADAIRVAHYFSEFFLSEARKSYHFFPTIEEEIDALIDNYKPQFSKNSSFEDVYHFKFKK